jgi:hypothetical protein
MTITEFTERLKVVKVKDTELLFRTADKTSLQIGGLFYGVKGADGMIATPQVGEEPNCIVAQVTPIEA